MRLGVGIDLGSQLVHGGGPAPAITDNALPNTDFSLVYWSRQTVTIEATGLADPLGGNRAVRVKPTTATSFYHGLVKDVPSPAIPVTANSIISYYFFPYTETAHVIRLMHYGATLVYVDAVLDYAAQTWSFINETGITADYSYGVMDVGAGWFRPWIRRNGSVTGNFHLYFMTQSAEGDQSAREALVCLPQIDRTPDRAEPGLWVKGTGE